MSGYNQSPSEPMRIAAAKLRQEGMSTFVRWNWIFCTPPLIITESQIREGLDIINSALNQVDSYYSD